MRKFRDAILAFGGRFPAVAAFSAVGVWLANRLTYANERHLGQAQDNTGLVLAMLAVLVLSAVVQTALERIGASRKAQFAAAGASLALFVATFFWFRWIGDFERDDFAIRYLLSMGAIAAMFAFFLARPADGERNLPMLIGPAFLGGAIALAVWGSLSLVFFALDELFGVAIGDIYEFLFFLSALSVAPAAFVLFAARETVKVNEKPLRIVMDYVLGPLALVNLAILVAYLAKCVFGGTLPRGEITWLVSTASSIWIAFCLVFSYSDTAFSSFFRRRVGYAIIPLLALQAVAIGIRIGQYGLTPMRYLASALTVFFAVAAVLSIVRKGRLVRWLYAVFAAMAIFSAFGPLNAIDASVVAQKRRIARLCREAGMEVADPMSIDRLELKSDTRFSAESIRRILDALDFVLGFHKSCGLYVGNAHRHYRASEPVRPDVPKRYSHYWNSLIDQTGGGLFSIDISGFDSLCPATVEWDSGVADSATEDEIANLAKRDPDVTVMVRPSASAEREIAAKASSFIPLIPEDYPTAMAREGVFALDGGMLLVYESRGRFYKLDEHAPLSDTNAVLSRISAKGLFFGRSGE